MKIIFFTLIALLLTTGISGFAQGFLIQGSWKFIVDDKKEFSNPDYNYLNGKLIGPTGSGDSYRNYLIKKEDILWDRENVIAVQIAFFVFKSGLFRFCSRLQVFRKME